jgi:hypothetical protein
MEIGSLTVQNRPGVPLKMPGKRRKVRYRTGLHTLDTLERDVRELTSEIKNARKDLLNELPARRRSDVVRPPGAPPFRKRRPPATPRDD